MWQKYTPWFIILCLTVLLVLKKEEIRNIYIPSKSNKVTISAPKTIILLDTIYKDGLTKVIEVKNPVNKVLLDKYTSLQDSISKLEVYKEAITERNYREILQDSVQIITVNSTVIGTLKNQTIEYNTFPQTIEIKTKTPKYSVFLGTFTTIPKKDITVVSIGANISLKTPKAMYTLGYTNQKQIQAGIAFKLF